MHFLFLTDRLLEKKKGFQNEKLPIKSQTSKVTSAGCKEDAAEFCVGNVVAGGRDYRAAFGRSETDEGEEASDATGTNQKMPQTQHRGIRIILKTLKSPTTTFKHKNS